MNYLIFILTGVLGAWLTFFISERLKQGPVRSSALLSLVVGLFLSPLSRGNYIRLAVAASLFGIIYVNKAHFFEGYGGALGALAFIALLSSMGFSVIISRSPRLKKGIVKVRKKVSRPSK